MLATSFHPARLYLLLFLVTLLPPSAAAGDDWLPIAPEELSMKDYAPSPGEHAVVLYREVEANHDQGWEDHYLRIKIFSEEGKKHADLELTYWKGLTSVDDIRARTIRPDGSIVPFKGKIFDKLVARRKGIKIQAKTFTLPEVTAGSILEYRYRLRQSNYWLYWFFGDEWEVQHELPTQRARFSLRPISTESVMWTWRHLPPGKQPEKKKGGAVELELESVPPFKREEYMPPEKEVRSWVGFYYTVGKYEPDRFWNDTAKDRHRELDSFIGKRKGIAAAAAQIAPATDPPEARLRKLYTHVLSLRNLTYEDDKTEKEEQREKLKDRNNVEDVLKLGYGSHNELNRLMVALARAIGLEAEVIYVADRDDSFFHKEMPLTGQISTEVAFVKLDGRELFLAPGVPFCPFGLLPWESTGTTALWVSKDGAKFGRTPTPQSEDSLLERKARLHLQDDGTLKGTLEVVLSGHDGLQERLRHVDDDDLDRKKHVEDRVKGWLPDGAAVELKNVNSWTSADQPLRWEFALTLPDFAAMTGKRVLLPTGIFQTESSAILRHAKRKFPVYFRNPWRTRDDITLELSAGMEVESTPAPTTLSIAVGSFELTHQRDGKNVRLTRTVSIPGVLYPLDYYPSLKDFFEKLKSHDEEQLVLRAAGVASAE